MLAITFVALTLGFRGFFFWHCVSLHFCYLGLGCLVGLCGMVRYGVVCGMGWGAGLLGAVV